MRIRRTGSPQPAILLIVAAIAAAVLIPPDLTALAAGDRAPEASLWARRYDGPGNSLDVANAVAVSPDGTRVFVTGSSVGEDGAYFDYATLAYDASTGHRLWLARYSGPGGFGDTAQALAVSPDGATVFVTGVSEGGEGDPNTYYATIAYDAATGATRWGRRYRGPGDGGHAARAIGVGPDGTTVFVTGGSQGTSTFDFATIAYDTATGDTRWVSRYRGPGDGARALGVSPDGATVFVTGSRVGTANSDYATVAYEASTGHRRWVGRYNGPAGGSDQASALAVGPLGDAVFVTGTSDGSNGSDYATVAYDASTGTQMWSRRHEGPEDAADMASGIAAGTDSVVVTGESDGETRSEYATVAYDAATGGRLWTRQYRGPARTYSYAKAIGMAPDGSAVFVTGASAGIGTGFYDYATVAYEAGTGATRWVHRYNGPGNGYDEARALAVWPDGGAVVVTGRSPGADGDDDYETIAYPAS